MDGEKFTRESKSSKRRVEPDAKTKEKTYGSKLKNDMSKSEAMRKKIRTGKADNRESLQEKKKKAKLRKQGRKKVYAETAVLTRVRSQMAEHNEDSNAGIDSFNLGGQLVESVIHNSVYSAKVKSHDKKSDGYSKKLHEKKYAEEAKNFQRAKETAKTSSGATGSSSKQMQKDLRKKEIQKQAYRKQAKEAANGASSIFKRFVDKAEDMVGKIAEAIAEFAREHPLGSILALIILMVVLVLSGSLSSCSMMAGGASNMILGTSFTAQDETIVQVNDDYIALEGALQAQIDNIESDYPGYDEYNYSLNEISHNPFELAALLTVLYEDYTRSEVQGMLQTILDSQYELTIQSVVETRTRTVTRWHWVMRYNTVIINGVTTLVPYQSYESYQTTEEYQYYILNVTLINHSIDYIARNMGMSADQLQRYEVLLTTFGNKKYLFENDPYSAPQPGDYPDYQVSSEYLTDQEFANMLREAEKYLGYPYVWGGSSPSTSFDCSGFVSYVINHCGNGWNLGRQTASGLLSNCTRISESNAKPGDLIFFQGTYHTSGASHVGIYVGNGMMIHCGNPIQYASVNTSYWRSHFYTYGRLNH